MTLDWAVSSAGLILIVGLLRFVLKDRLRAGFGTRCGGWYCCACCCR